MASSRGTRADKVVVNSLTEGAHTNLQYKGFAGSCKQATLTSTAEVHARWIEGVRVGKVDKKEGGGGCFSVLYRQLQPGLEVVLNPLVDDPDRLGLHDPCLLEGPEQLAHGLGAVLDNEHDQLPLLLCHNLGLLHKGGGATTGGGCSSSWRWCRFRLDVEVELGLELAELVFHHALVVAAVVGTRLLEHTTTQRMTILV